VYLPDPAIAPWIDTYVVEHSAFPNGAHDDQVDATTQALLRLLGGQSGAEQAMNWLHGYRSG
jgi:predicted phage terminase large subunit-like protein